MQKIESRERERKSKLKDWISCHPSLGLAFQHSLSLSSSFFHFSADRFPGWFFFFLFRRRDKGVHSHIPLHTLSQTKGYSEKYEAISTLRPPPPTPSRHLLNLIWRSNRWLDDYPVQIRFDVYFLFFILSHFTMNCFNPGVELHNKSISAVSMKLTSIYMTWSVSLLLL